MTVVLSGLLVQRRGVVAGYRVVRTLGLEGLARALYFTHHNMAHVSSGCGVGGGLVAVAQMTSTQDKQANYDTCASLVAEAVQAGAKLVFLPECCDYIAEAKDDSLAMAEPMSGPSVARFKELARSHGVWLSLGGLHIKEPGEDKMSNTHLLLNSVGVEVGRYTKTHLFSAHIPERGVHLREDTYVIPGSAIHPPTSTPVGNLGLGICYDLRFAEFGLLQRQMGAEILTFPSAFTVPTGLAHWEALLRARAIETQCYVVASAQTGQHNKKRSSYGHSMIVDPWGAVICQTSEGTGIALANINLPYVYKVRSEMQVGSHRRSDLCHISQSSYSQLLGLVKLHVGSSAYVSHQFGSVQVPGSCVFLRSQRSFAFVNKKPVAPGHVLLCPERPAHHMADLTPSELCDLTQLAQATLKVIRGHYASGGQHGVQLAIQEGAAAGQTIQHLHLHIIPLTPSLMDGGGNDGGLQGHEEGKGRWREVAEMEQETEELRRAVEGMLPSLSSNNSTLPGILDLVNAKSSESVVLEEMRVPGEAVFARTRHSFAFIAPGPVLPGHVYIASLEREEGSDGYGGAPVDRAVDIILATQLIQSHLQNHFGSEAATIVLINEHRINQHSKVQIIPRRTGDLSKNDDIYAAVLKHQTSASNWSFTEDNFILARQLKELIYEGSN